MDAGPKKVLAALERRLAKGFSPTQVELAEDCGFSTQVVRRHLAYLEGAGIIVREQGVHRGLRIVPNATAAGRKRPEVVAPAVARNPQ